MVVEEQPIAAGKTRASCNARCLLQRLGSNQSGWPCHVTVRRRDRVALLAQSRFKDL